MKSPQINKKRSRIGNPGRSGLWMYLTLAVLVGFAIVVEPASTVYAADCPDNDKDGYIVYSGGCTVPQGKLRGDCNDADSSIHPGAAEFCGDKVDNDCDGSIDFNAGSECSIGRPAGCTEASPESPCCLTKSVLECKSDGTGAICVTPEGELDSPVPELAYTDACHDGIDNDCDTLIDIADPDCIVAVERRSGLLDVFLSAVTVRAADCPDNDKDGYVVCSGGCTVPQGKLCGDCNDANSSIHPGAAEFCGDKVDNDCDGSIDFNAGSECSIGRPAGCTEASPESPCCLTKSVLECKSDGTGAICVTPEGELDSPVPELAYTDACHDELDNDCDTLIDIADPDCIVAIEQCNGLDDDYDGIVDNGFNVGQECTVGEGACARQGLVICSSPTKAGCSASPGPSRPENTPGTGSCVDGIDNDCDGYVDAEDPGCQTAEKCDGLDNDGDGLIDEDFQGLGESCSAGYGQCESEGTVVCSPDGKTVLCSATPSLSGTEGPSGATCQDGIDNDCDGFVDADDPDCSSSDFAVVCALPYYQGRWRDGWSSCVGLHRILFATNADLEKNPNAVLTSELFALDEQGNTLASIPVKNGDLARLASRVRPEDWVVRSTGSQHTVFAPVPMLRVTLDDGKTKQQAFCSNIPYLQVLEPQGKVVAESEGDDTRVLVAMPLVDSRNIAVKVDGVEIFSALGISKPSTCTWATPCSGVIQINDRPVQITDLWVQSSSVWLPGMNSLNMRLSNLGCGEHIFSVLGRKRPGSFPTSPDEQCLSDDLTDKGSSSGLSILIDSPEQFEVLASAPVQVTGLACSGREISEVSINGKGVGLSGQTFTPGDGESSGNRYDVPIITSVGLTNLAQDVSTGNAPLNTFDLGSNRLSARVTDDLGNRSFDSKMFAIGNVSLPEVEAGLQASLKEALVGKILEAGKEAVTEIDNAFVVGLSKDAIQKLFNERAKAAAQQFVNNLSANIINQEVDRRKVEVSVCSCDPTVITRITGFTANANEVSCPITFEDGKIKVVMNLPTVDVSLGVNGYCRVGDPVFDICISKTTVSGSTHAVLSGARVEFEITEQQLLGNEPPSNPIFVQPVASEPPTGNINVSIGCLSTLCDILLSPIAFIVNGIAGDRLIPVLGFGMTIDVNFEADLGSSQPDPIKLKEIKIDEQKVKEFEQKLEGIMSSVQITPQGLVAGLKGKFETLSVDPEVEPTPGAVLTPAGIPAMPVPNADEVFVALADDTFNQMFASLAMSGKLKTGCQSTGKTLGDLLPASCDDIVVGECSNDSSISCKTGSDCSGGFCQENLLKTGIAKGACQAFKGQDCNVLPLAQRLVCKATETKLNAINISANQPLLFCMRQDIPPRLLIQDNDATSFVETVLRLNDMSVALVVDRDGDGQLNGDLSSTHKCLAEGAPVIGDCSFFGACLDLNLETAMQLATKYCENDKSVLCSNNSQCASVGGTCVDVCEGGIPGFLTRIDSVQPTIRSLGVVCGGAATAGDDDLLANTSGQDQTIDIVLQNANRFTPPACIQGLTLGDFVQFKNPRLFAIDVDGEPTFDDYLGLTGTVQ